MDNSIRIALIHLNVHYKKPEINRSNLFRFNLEAALQEADIILNTELSVAGYSFNSREDISEYVETGTGLTVMGLADIARQHSKYIGIGLAERDDTTGIYYNSAIMIGPDGRQICRYRKINAEIRWGCPGHSKQENTFDTPWGRVGILICSDTYYGLFPRSMALKGVDLLWVPANWPPEGIDAKEVWRARVLENGFFLAACNRSGKDRIMNCRDAISCVYDPQGREIFSASSEESSVFFADLPLDENGKLRGVLHGEKLENRTPVRYAPIYLDLRQVDDLPRTTDFLNLHRCKSIASFRRRIPSKSILWNKESGTSRERDPICSCFRPFPWLTKPRFILWQKAMTLRFVPPSLGKKPKEFMPCGRPTVSMLGFLQRYTAKMTGSLFL